MRGMQRMGDYFMAFLFLELWWASLGYFHSDMRALAANEGNFSLIKVKSSQI